MVQSPFELKNTEYDPHENTKTRTNTSAENALDRRAFEDLFHAAKGLDEPYRLQSEFILLATGRLGLRSGELVHLKSDWIDTEKHRVNIPAHEPCTNGSDGGICGYCRQLAAQMADTNEELGKDEAEELFWKAKTANAKRGVPYNWSDRCVDVVTEFVSEYDSFPVSKSGIDRRVKKCVENCRRDLDNISPHALRATAATYHASTGMDVWTLQALMGWAYPNTAENYIVNNADRTEVVLNRHHNF